MTLVKYGIASVFVASASLLACGGSSSDSGGAAGGPSNSAGASHSSAGANGSGQAGGAPVGSGGTCATTLTTMLDPTTQMCPAGVSCIQTKCKAELDAFTSPTGTCSKCVTACNCEQTCVQNCAQASDCQTGLQPYLACTLMSCLTEFSSCANPGAGGAGGGVSASGKTCADLSTCCAALTDANQKMVCTQLAAQKVDEICGAAYASICG